MPPKIIKTDNGSGNKTDHKQEGTKEGDKQEGTKEGDDQEGDDQERWSIIQKAMGVGAVGAIVAVGLWLSKK